MEKKGVDRANVGMSQKAGTSKVNDIEYEGASTESLSDADIRAPMDFDDLHPPSPKVPKGGIIKTPWMLVQPIFMEQKTIATRNPWSFSGVRLYMLYTCVQPSLHSLRCVL